MTIWTGQWIDAMVFVCDVRVFDGSVGWFVCVVCAVLRCGVVRWCSGRHGPSLVVPLPSRGLAQSNTSIAHRPPVQSISFGPASDLNCREIGSFGTHILTALGL